MRGAPIADFCVNGKNVRRAAMPTAAAAKIVRLIMITAAGDSPRAMNTAIVAPIRPASVNSCQGSNEGCDSVEVSELIVEAGIDRWIEGHICAAGAGRSRLRRPAARRDHEHQQPHEGEPVRQEPGKGVESTTRYREHGGAVLLDERSEDVVLALSFVDVLLQLGRLRIESVAGGSHGAVVQRAAHTSTRSA